MAYLLREVTIRTNNKKEGMQRIDELWADITAGKLPLLFDSQKNFQQGISPVSRYSNYVSDENGDYDLTIIGVTSSFFEGMDNLVTAGKYKRYESSDDDLGSSAKKAWEIVWSEKENNIINRAFTSDYESTVPAEYTKDGKAHCYLYIAVL